MSLKNLEASIKKVDALQKYEDVVKDFEKCKKKIIKLQLKLKKAEKKNTKTEEKLEHCEKLKIQFADKETSLEELNTIILKRTRETKYEEIERKAQQKFETQALNLTKKELDRLLQLPSEKRPETLKKLMEKEIDLNVNQILKIHSLWPPWFKVDTSKRILREANRLKNSDYYTSINVAVKKKKREEWQPYLEKYTRDTIIPYLMNITINKFIKENAQRTLTLPCDKCGMITPIKLSPEVLTKLFQDVTYRIKCKNSQCKGIALHTTLPYSLATLIIALTEAPSMPIK